MKRCCEIKTRFIAKDKQRITEELFEMVIYIPFASTLHKTLIRSIVTYAWPAWEFAADNHLLKLQGLQNKVLRTTGNFPRRTPVRNLHMAFKLPYIFDYITKLCRQQAKVIHNHENANVRNIGQGEPRHKIYKRLKLSGGQAYVRSND
jgi:hypothetical protein